MLSPEQLDCFSQHGFVRIPSAFSTSDAAKMEDVVWDAVENQYGVKRDDSSTWIITHNMVTGVQHLKDNPVFQAIGSEHTIGGLESLLGAKRWKKPRDWGQFLITSPTQGAVWKVPYEVWHTDFEYDICVEPLDGLLVFSYVCDVDPFGGGTVAVSGSHRLIKQFVKTQPDNVLQKMKTARKALMQSDPWLNELSSKTVDGQNRKKRFMDQETVVDGVPLQVVELHGKAGDIVIGHPWLLHTTAPNCGERFRMMCIQRIRCVS